MRTASRWTPAGCVRSPRTRARSARPRCRCSMARARSRSGGRWRASRKRSAASRRSGCLRSPSRTRRLDSVQWLREAVTEAKLHETATAQAMRAALVEFLGRLDPAELEARFERAARRGSARSADKAQYWELFATFYRNLIEMPADHL